MTNPKIKLNMDGVYLGKPLTPEEQADWECKLELFSHEIREKMDEYIEKMRISRMKSWSLAKTRFIG